MPNSGREPVCCCNEPDTLLPCDRCGCVYVDASPSSDLCDSGIDNEFEFNCECHPRAYIRCGASGSDCCTTTNTQDCHYLCPECITRTSCKCTGSVKTAYWKKEPCTTCPDTEETQKASVGTCSGLLVKISCREIAVPVDYCESCQDEVSCEDCCCQCYRYGQPCSKEFKKKCCNVERYSSPCFVKF